MRLRRDVANVPAECRRSGIGRSCM